MWTGKPCGPFTQCPRPRPPQSPSERVAPEAHRGLGPPHTVATAKLDLFLEVGPQVPGTGGRPRGLQQVMEVCAA